jgi:hypothetical protein
MAMSPLAERIFQLSPDGYTCGALHAHDRDFRETNCYIDVWLEVLHALGVEALACLGFTLASDFEGDQWTFFKPPHIDLDRLYGVRVEELTLWRPLLEHAKTQVARKRMPLVEVDSYFLPDTAGTDYRRNHVKTTVAMTFVDAAQKKLHYFHNTGYHQLGGEDFDGVFHPALSERPDYLPPYCEIIKADRAHAKPLPELRALSLEMARHHFALRPTANPVRAHAEQLPKDLELIAAGGLPTYHAYSFAVMRQLGAGYEMAASYMRWLDASSAGPAAQAAECFAQISAGAKMLILRLARVANTKRVTDLSGSFVEMAAAWDRGMNLVSDVLKP